MVCYSFYASDTTELIGICLDNILLRDKKLRELPKPRKRDHRNFMDYIYTENSLVGPGEKNFIYHEHDFVLLQDHEDSWLDDRIKAFMEKLDQGFLRVPTHLLVICHGIFTNSNFSVFHLSLTGPSKDR